MKKLLEGDNIILTAVNDSDIENMEKWFNDLSFLRYYDYLPSVPKTYKEIKEFIDEFTKANDKYIFAIRKKESKKIIGIAGFDDILWNNGVATVFIGIGEKEYISKGFGKESLCLLIDFGFFEFNFHRIQLNVISYNNSAINLYEGVGFKREGVYREFLLRDDKRYDMYLYGLLKQEWKA
ncbi:Protein N-acetyltransferase, RimJ/RimL family [Caloramator quimbayensis]|uniref:Protein N-acetyltransferase, RimJ/RimL family n=1 Tax=Caloramator quimbayensis TaxID=1147123 RepID=A0A1T4Y1V2_9CLOT|nr:GNAT family protein [Caloramator quimbayensis]SKA95746.1 Protein N-acetyltransferase, RimJ/RimL family [Caloramator quimbayensis]